MKLKYKHVYIILQGLFSEMRPSKSNILKCTFLYLCTIDIISFMLMYWFCNVTYLAKLWLLGKLDLRKRPFK